MTQLYLPSSDLDLVVVGSLGLSPLRKLATALEAAGLAARMELIEKARVPIIKMVDSVVGFNVDISFNVTSGVDSGRLVKEAIEIFPALRPLMMVIKQFLLERGLNEVFSGGLGSYSLAVMIISFLQLHPRVQTGEVDPSDNLGVFLVEFLELYGRSFGNANVGVSVLAGGSYMRRVR